MDLAKSYTSIAPAMICKFPAKKNVVVLPLSILWGNTPDKWVDMAQNDNPSIIGEVQICFQLLKLNSVPCHLLEIKITPPLGYPPFTPACEQFLVVTKPGVANRFYSIIQEMTS